MNTDENTVGQYVFSTKPGDTARYRFPTHTNELIMDRSLSEAAEAFLVILEPGEAPPLHQHAEHEQVFYIVEGSGALRIGEEEARYFPVGPGDLVRIPRSTPHAIKCEGDKALRYVSVDCFTHGTTPEEPTFDVHARAMCQEQGWDYEKVRAG